MTNCSVEMKDVVGKIMALLLWFCLFLFQEFWFIFLMQTQHLLVKKWRCSHHSRYWISHVKHLSLKTVLSDQIDSGQ